MNANKTINLSDYHPYADADNNIDIDFAPPSKRIKQENLMQYEQKKSKQQLKRVKETKVLPKRNRVKTNRFGKRISTSNHDSYFVSLENAKKTTIISASTASAGQTNSNSKKNFENKSSVNEQNSERVISSPLGPQNKSNTTSSNGFNIIERSATEVSVSHGMSNTANDATGQNFMELDSFQQSFLVQFLINFQNSINEKFKVMEVSMDCLKVQVARVEAKITESGSILHQKNTEEVDDHSVTPTSIGFPIKRKEDLDIFEQRLNDLSFQDTVVSLMFKIHRSRIVFDKNFFLDLSSAQSS